MLIYRLLKNSKTSKFCFYFKELAAWWL